MIETNDIIPIVPPSIVRKKWWRSKRRKYNLGLVIAGVLAFICYAIVSESLIMPYDHDFEITLFTILFQGIGYLIMMAIANLFYNLGYFVDKNFNKANSEKVRKRIFNLGYWFSFCLPFLIPILLIVQYFVIYRR